MKAIKRFVISGIASLTSLSGVAAQLDVCREVTPNNEGYGSIFTVDGVSYRKVNEDWSSNDDSAYWCQVQAAPAASEQPDVQIAALVYNGNGCPKDGSTINASLVGNDLLLDLSGMAQAVAAPEVERSAAYKSCQAAIQLSYPSGWTYAVAGMQRSGGLYLEDGTTASLNQIYYFTGQATTLTNAVTLAGPYNGDFALSGSFDNNQLEFAPCGQNLPLNIRTDVHLTRSNRAASAASMEQLSKIILVWQRCF